MFNKLLIGINSNNAVNLYNFNIQIKAMCNFFNKLFYYVK